MTLLPRLRPADWGNAAGILARRLDAAVVSSPWVTFHHERSTLESVSAGAIEAIEREAVAGLRARGVVPTVDDASFNDGSIVRIAILEDRFASEHVLDRTTLRDLQRRLRASGLLVGIPDRGRLLAISIDEEDVHALAGFLRDMRRRFDVAKDPITPIALQISDGQIVGWMTADEPRAAPPPPPSGLGWAVMSPTLQILAGYALQVALTRVREAPGIVPFVLQRHEVDAVPTRRDLVAPSFDAANERYYDWVHTEATGNFVYAYELVTSRNRTICLHVESAATAAFSILQNIEWSPAGAHVVGEAIVGLTQPDAIARPIRSSEARAADDHVVVLAPDQPDPGCIAVLDRVVYWQSKHTRRLSRVDLYGGAVEPVTGRIMTLSALVATSDDLIGTGYWEVVRIDPRSGAVTTLADWRDDDFGHGHAIVVGGDTIYVNEGSRVLAIPRSGGSHRVIYEGGSLEGLALHDADLLFARDETDVCAIPISGGEPRVLATSRPGIRRVVSDGRSIFWSDTGTSTVYRLGARGPETIYADGDAMELVASAGQVAFHACRSIVHVDGATNRVTTLATEIRGWPCLAFSGDYVVAAVTDGDGLGRIVRLDLPME